MLLCYIVIMYLSHTILLCYIVIMYLSHTMLLCYTRPLLQ